MKYSDQQLLNRVSGLKSFQGFPKTFWLLAVRSKADVFNKFDDKFYLFHGERFVKVWKGTTNAGVDMLKPTNSKGEAILKSDEIYYNSHVLGLHRNKVLAYRQHKTLPVFRDKNRDRRTDETGELDYGMFGINIHPASYRKGELTEKDLIGLWSQGCLVFQVRAHFDNFMQITNRQKFLTVCLLKEF